MSSAEEKLTYLLGVIHSMVTMIDSSYRVDVYTVSTVLKNAIKVLNDK